MHVRSGYPLYCLEAHQRMSYYPPPIYSGGNWGYYTPYLWYDGKKGGTAYSTWGSQISDRMNQPAPVTITMWGHYELSADTGRIYARFRNDSTDAVNGRVLLVITEDSIYYAAPNGDHWHNYVARDYLPTQNGQMVSIPAGDSITVNQPLYFNPGWERQRCYIVTWIQNDNMQPDSTKEIWQGGILKATALTGIEEEKSEEIILEKLIVVPNPCVTSTAFMFSLPPGEDYSIGIYDAIGRHVRTLQGISAGRKESVQWDRKNKSGSLVGAGVYFYLFESKTINATGKIVVR